MHYFHLQTYLKLNLKIKQKATLLCIVGVECTLSLGKVTIMDVLNYNSIIYHGKRKMILSKDSLSPHISKDIFNKYNYIAIL